ncbi:hypothetical protein HK405_011971, partial [Cladochytrium tenue]
STRLATGGADGVVKVWDLRNIRAPEVKSFSAHASGEVWEVVFDPEDARRVVSCSEDGTLSYTTWSFGASDMSSFLSSSALPTPGSSSSSSSTRLRPPSHRLPLTSLDVHLAHPGLVAAAGDAAATLLLFSAAAPAAPAGSADAGGVGRGARMPAGTRL